MSNLKLSMHDPSSNDLQFKRFHLFPNLIPRKKYSKFLFYMYILKISQGHWPLHKLIANRNCMIKQANKMPVESFEETNQLASAMYSVVGYGMSFLYKG